MRRETLHRHTIDQVCILPLLLPLSLLLRLVFVFFFSFLGAITFAGTRVLVCWNSNDVVWSLWDIKRRRFGLFYFFKTPPKTTSFGTKSLIQTTSFWISDLKQFQNDVVLDFGSPKQCRFGMCRELKKKTTTFQNDAFLYQKGPKRRCFSC